ncbi:MAG: hypothetical protein HYV47_04050 [Candidatus Nealsonbacteria bacterium]|nr:hypothetical protein [Candidatus Nealsonbacteria bacterium]
MKSKILRKKYPRFIYRNYGYEIKGGDLKISFFFEIPPGISFRPQIIIKKLSRTHLVPTRNVLDNLIFHVGLIEMLSYWKATCSPKIIIEAGYLNKEQISWWKNLIIKGMGQFFYENKINWRKSNFLTIASNRLNYPMVELRRTDIKLKNKHLVPMGGGRDSIVTLEKLRRARKKINAFTVNPTKAAKDVLRVAGIKNPIIVERKIDPKLLELNKEGALLNGHTPFTALLSFLSVFCAVLFGYKNIAFSNEKSANEGNVKYLGRIINHQWAKSSEFEKMFKYYCKKYLAKNINYFSYLRKYGELEISKMFAKYPKYFSVFSSCNLGSKIGERWCGKCPKCLFVYISLYPLLRNKDLLKIFGKDLLQDKKLLPLMKSLIGEGIHKPFECVGTYQESREAALLSFEEARKLGKIPYLLKQVRL